MTDEPWLEDAVAGRPAAAEGLANPAQVNFRPLAEQGDPTRRNPNVNQVIMMLRDREASK